MRIAHFLVGTQEGGAEEFLMKLVEAQHQEGEELLLILGPHEKRITRLREIGIKNLPLSFDGVVRDFLSRRKMAKAIKEFRPHIVQCWMSRAGRRTKKGPYVSIGRLGGYYPVKNYESCDHIIANTPGILEFVRKEGWPSDKAHLISNFSSLKKFPPIDRALFETPEDAKVILAMGRLDWSKGFDVLIEAIAQLPENFILWLAGVGPDEVALKTQTQRLGLEQRVRFLGWRNDASALYQTADVYVMSSRDEPLGNVVLEAFESGVPVVAVESPGPSWIITDRQDGVIVPKLDAQSMANAIKEIVEDEALKNKLVENARITVQERFSKAAILRQYRKLYQKSYREKFGLEIKD